MSSAKEFYLGNTFPTNLSGDVVVLEYENHNSVLIQYVNTGYLQWVEGRAIKKGRVMDPYAPLACGIGWIGKGLYNSSTHRKEYQHWFDMLCRVTGCKPGRYSTYADTSVKRDWLNFQNFAEWCQWQKGFLVANCQLDKDILVKGNREYGPDTCCFVPSYINMVVVNTEVKGHKNKTCATWQFTYKERDGSKGQANFYTQEEGQEWHKINRERVIKEIAEEYKDQLDYKTYVALLNFRL